jgi:hypothetical protein
LEHVPRKCLGLDYKISNAALKSSKRNAALYGILRREGRESRHAHLMCNGGQSLWHLYTFFALPRMANGGLTITYTIIDLVAIKVFGGDAGLGDFWNRWRDCFMRVRNPPNKDDYEYVFVGEMRKTQLMVKHIRDYDEMEFDDPNKTWQWLVEKGRRKTIFPKSG